MIKINRIITLVCLAAGLTFADAVQIVEENDFLLPKGNDNQYTQGASLGYIHPYINSNGVPEREMFSISQKIYTPNDTTQSGPQPYDRPYCATLTGSYETWTKGTWFDSETVNQVYEVGVLGPYALGEEAQNGVHAWLTKMGRPNLPAMGWSNQLKNELVANYYNERYTTMFDEKNGKWEVNLESIYGATAGTEFINTFGGGKVMFGYNLPPLKVLGGMYPKLTQNGIESETGWFIYGFVQEKIYAVAHNGTLGQSYLYGQESAVTPYPVVQEMLYGINIGWDYISLSYAIGNRSKEYFGQQGTMDWGSIIISIGTTF